MNLPVPKYNTDPLNFHFLLEDSSDGQILGTIAELPGCQVTAATQDEAIGALQEMTRDRLVKMTVVPFSLPNTLEFVQDKHPWEEFIGMFAGDPIFAEIAAEQRAERGLEHLGWIE
jgi:hypothetical protein